MASLNLHSSIWQFAIELYEKIQSCVAPDQNIIFSPFSIHLALSLCLMGSDGKTATEIACGLAMADFDKAVIPEEYQKIILSMDKQLELANKIFVMTGNELQIPFNNVVTTQFKSEIQDVDFSDSSGAADIINSWIDNKTNHRIRDCVPPCELNDLTRLVLVNTIHFKCKWENKFDIRSTKKQPFFHSDTESTEVDMMWQQSYFLFSKLKKLDCDGIKLRYDDSLLSMVILLPTSRTGLDGLNSRLKNTSFPNIFEQIHSTKYVSLSLPKFTAKFELMLNKVLMQMGMTSMFEVNLADFSGMLQNESQLLFVKTIVHNAYIEVTELGTEAGAVTRANIEVFCEPPEPVPFNADHPFRYFIIDSKNVVLFDGCYRNVPKDNGN